MEYLAFFFLATWRLTVLHLRHRYETIQVHNLPDFLVFAALVPKLMGARLILDLHDLMPEFFAGRAEVGIHHRMVKMLKIQEKLACRFADHVITVTDGWRDTLIERGVPAEKVSVMMNVADAHIFHRDIVSTPGDGFHLIYHGTFTPRYGVDLLIRAVALARSEVPDIRLTILGDGEAREELVELVRELGFTDNVVVSPRMLAAAELPPLLAQADVGVVPNRSNVFTDGLLPTKLLEYVAMGIPVIAARTPTIASYFDDSMIQFFEPGDVDELAGCIRTLHRDRTLLKALATNADDFNHRYDWPAVSTAFADLVLRLGGGRTSGDSHQD
jgi:glycosyltransferase involved in cell wall biosynthesis